MYNDLFENDGTNGKFYKKDENGKRELKEVDFLEIDPELPSQQFA